MTETETEVSACNLKRESNRLVVVVHRWTSGSYMEDQDMWWLSGIHRSVELSCRLKQGGILDYVVTTTADHETGNAAVHVDVETDVAWVPRCTTRKENAWQR